MAYSIHTKNLIIVSVVFGVIAIGAVALRLIARRQKRLPLYWDDWTMIVALVIAVAQCVVCVYGATEGGIGHPSETLTPPTLVKLFKVNAAFAGYAASILSNNYQQVHFSVIQMHLSALTFIKISILCFYRRIFTIKWFTRVVDATIGFVVVWWLTFFIATFFTARPLSNFWNTFLQDLAFDIAPYVLAIAATDVAVDFWTLLLPLPVIAGLQMKSAQKWQVVGILWLGVFCVVSASVRLYYIQQVLAFKVLAGEKFTGVLTNNFVWAVIEPCASILCGCLPTYGSLATACAGHIKSVWSSYGLYGSQAYGSGKHPNSGLSDNVDDSGSKRTRREWLELQDSQQKLTA
ncbi:uncharacterized protein BP5553_07115 [Venustampulla echinocandica]|uniref:Rhodopsin domain-containing protein n=1 Tax=Venustampulla echinocandica TaxID=2656787 RepID=A0A370TIJ4_9HELO|nr:uncharacterized protein BP5553_07115 [Venustampulla echinocandica]RDL35184.1 hypothetical protein BP5553_07115 [Venustampulla echinocandica]